MNQQSTTSRAASIARATAKARQMAEQGIRPTLKGWDASGIVYAVPSASHEGHTYTVTMHRVATGIASECDCQAGQRGNVCYHRALARLFHAGELASTEPTYAMAAD